MIKYFLNYDNDDGVTLEKDTFTNKVEWHPNAYYRDGDKNKMEWYLDCELFDNPIDLLTEELNDLQESIDRLAKKKCELESMLTKAKMGFYD